MSNTFAIFLPDLEATRVFGRRLGRILQPGMVIGLIGPLGAGKTYLTRAVAEGLGIADSRVVNSPTFVLIQEYQARLPIYHFDTYRLNAPEEFLDLGVDEYFESQGVCLIEWADRVGHFLPADHLQIAIEIAGESARRIVVTGLGERTEVVVKELEGLKERGQTP